MDAADVRSQILDVARGQLSLDAFEQWLDERVWDGAEQSSADDAILSAARSLFAQRDDLSIAPARLEQELIGLLDSIVVSAPVETASDRNRKSVTASQWFSAAGLQPAQA
jgi:hypothetical protein